MKHRWGVLLLCLGLCGLTPLQGTETAFWQVGTFEDFLQGTLQGVSLSKEGELRLAPEASTVFNPEEALALSITADRNRTLYVGTGHQGKVFRLNADLKGSLLFTAQEPDIFALAVGPDGALYAGSSPEGKIYRITPDGKSQVFFDPKAKYIWALAFDAQGRLYAGTGDQGKIWRIDSAGKGEVFFDSRQTHIMCLTLDREGSVLAGSVPNGLIFRITPQGKASVLYQANLPEIHELVTDSQGRIYAAALGAAGGKGTPDLLVLPAPGTGAPSAVTTVTVIAGSGEVTSPAARPQTPPAESTTTPSFSRPAPSALGFPAPQLPQGRGSLIRILPDYTVETIWSSNSEAIFGLAMRKNRLLFSTDSNGRIFELDPTGESPRLTLLAQTHESLATRLLLQEPDLYITTSNIAKLFRLGETPGQEGRYASPVKDAKFISRWGVLAWRGEVSTGSTLEFFSRSGNSERPDPTWNDWAGPYRDPNGSPVLSPPARYIQWKAVLRSSGTASPTLHDVTLTYLNQNLPPQIRSLSVSTGSERMGLTGAPSASGVVAGSSITVSSVSSAGLVTTAPGGRGAAKTPTTLNWQADDPNADQLIYTVYVKAADEQEWHLLKDKLRQTSYALEAQALPDGRYMARVVASDEESNPPATARKAGLVSAPFWMDNTPPRVRVLKQEVSSGGVEVQFQAEDETSPLRSAEAATDRDDWKEMYADDGIVDSPREIFTLKVGKLEPGEHLITLRAYDTAGNGGVGKAVVRIPVGGGPPR